MNLMYILCRTFDGNFIIRVFRRPHQPLGVIQRLSSLMSGCVAAVLFRSDCYISVNPNLLRQLTRQLSFDIAKYLDSLQKTARDATAA